MISFEDTRIRLYEAFMRNIVNEIVHRIDFEKLDKEGKTFLAKTKERLRFDNDKGLKFLTSSLDTIGDSQFAIVAFMNSEAQNRKKFITGENYLRLYGLLSAVYIQQQAVLKLWDLFKVGQIDKLKTRFDTLEITFLRHCISAHPINYENNEKKVSFKIDRHSLGDLEELSIRDESNDTKYYNVFDLLNEYVSLAEQCLEEVCKKSISNCYKTAKEKLEELNSKLVKIKARE